LASHAFEKAFVNILKHQDAKQHPTRARRPMADRLHEMMALLDQTNREWTMLEMAEALGCSYERVHQIMQKARNDRLVSWRRKGGGRGKGGHTILVQRRSR
jgi:DNA-directed RNA polymerase specialized sigma subunit